MNENQWTENIIVADADYVDKVAFDLIVNFERMLERRIPQADMARWAECVALDGGLREGNHSTTVVLIHDPGKDSMSNFAPGRYADQLHGKAFSGQLGEFTFMAVSTEGLAPKAQLLVDTLQVVIAQPQVKRLMVIPDAEQYNKVRATLNSADSAERHTTVFAMQPMPGGAFRQEILGYSLMAALGIKADEIHAQ